MAFKYDSVEKNQKLNLVQKMYIHFMEDAKKVYLEDTFQFVV